MPWQLWSRLRSLHRWSRKESELDEEIQFHLAEEADERAAGGLAPEQARAAARKDFGSAALVREDVRETWGWASAERLIQDVRCAMRMIRRDAGFSAVAVLTLALGIAATTGVLDVVNSLVLRRLPFPDAERLVVLFATTPARGIYRDTTSFHDFTAWKDESRSFTNAAAYRQETFNVTGDGTPEPVPGVRASYELLNVLGRSPAIGRTFDEQEQRGNHPVALISHGLWARRYGSDPDILSRTISLNEVSHSIIGVLPAGFEFPLFTGTDVIAPVPVRACRSCGYIRVVARLKPESSAATAQQELDAIAQRLASAFPDSNEGRGVNLVSLQTVAVGPVQTSLMALLGAGVFVLLIGCGNVGNLVLARGLARQRELAVRTVLGAGTGRLVRQLLTESVALAGVAAMFGAALAIMGSKLIVTSLAQRFPLPDVAFNWTLLLAALVIAVLSGLISGLPSALMAWRADLSHALKQDGRSQSAGVTQHRLRNLLVVFQTALTVMLLIGAGLLVKSFVFLQRVEIGINPQGVLTADLALSKRYANAERRDVFLQELLDSIRELPGVQAVAAHTDSPFRGGGSRETFIIEGLPDPSPRNGHPASTNVIAGDFLRALGVAVIGGRPFDARETRTSPPVALVNETMARQFWTNENPIGKRIRLYYDKDPNHWFSIIGVVGDIRYRRVDPTPQVFLSTRQDPYRLLPYASDPLVSLIVRTGADPAALIPAVQSRIWSVDRDQPILNLQPMDHILWRSMAEPRIYTIFLGVFAVIALAIASAGIYGISAYAVVRRTREIGIRLALGATTGQIRALIVRRGLSLILVGVAIGIAGALALTNVMAGFLYGVSAADPSTIATVLFMFGLVAFVSTCIPANRAARIAPSSAFRYE